MNYKCFVYLVIIILFCSACKNYAVQFPENLVGKWILDYPNAKGFETWQKINDSTYIGQNFANPNLLLERMNLVRSDNSWNMIIERFDAGKTDLLFYKMTSNSKHKFIFENKKKDFPQQIIYKFRVGKSLVVTLKSDNKQYDIFYKQEQ